MENIFLNSRSLPLAITPKRKRRSFEALIDTAVSNKDVFFSQLLRHGALLFRGFEIQNKDQFSEFVQKFSGKDFFNYAGGASPRNSLGNNVYNSTEYPPEMMLELHNELSYSADYPQHLYFYCQTAPQKGGETILGDCRRILRGIRPKIVGLFKHKNLLYERNLTSDAKSPYSWQKAFETGDKAAVEEICRRVGAEFEWQNNDVLVIRQARPAVSRHSKTSEDVWFNQAHGFHPSGLDKKTSAYFAENKIKPRLNSFFGDGSPICVLMLEHIRRVLRKESVPHRWEKGDILILDNILTAHGRMPYSGDRKIVLAMT